MPGLHPSIIIFFKTSCLSIFYANFLCYIVFYFYRQLNHPFDDVSVKEGAQYGVGSGRIWQVDCSGSESKVSFKLKYSLKQF